MPAPHPRLLNVYFHQNRAAVGPSRAPSLGNDASVGGSSSVDDRVSFRRDGSASSSAWPASSPRSGGAPNAVAAASSDWLLAGETARAGMIESVSAENSGRSGTQLVDDGVFQTRLLCPSQVRELVLFRAA